MKEKRRFIRFETSIKVNYIIERDPRIEKTCTTKNINTGGIQLLTDEKLEPNKKIELKLFIPGALNPAHIKGKILWSSDIDPQKGKAYAAGIEFNEIEEDNKNTFLKFLCELTTQKK
ncbi:MAG: PilZ domain-containing protein [Candidatus Omnitrophota bacterium]